MNTEATTTTTGTLGASSALDHGDWMSLAKTEYERMAILIGSFAADDWSKPTDCTGWDTKAMVAHLLGAAESSASILETVRQLRTARKWAKENDGMLVDGLSATQVAARIHLSPAELTARYGEVWPRALRGRGRIPAVFRNLIKVPGDVPGISEKWTLGYLNDCIYTRDSWMHRIDLSRAVGREFEVTETHDGLIVSDLVSEWASRHGQPYELQLTGPAGGTFSSGSGGPVIELDAIEFARVISGRAPGDGLLSAVVPF